MSVALSSTTAPQGEAPVIGRGYFTTHDYRAWERVRQCLPKEIREHPHAAFPIPALAEKLKDFFRDHGYSKDNPMPLTKYRHYADARITQYQHEKVWKAACARPGDSRYSPDHSYHGKFHSTVEVPTRYLELFGALKDDVRERLASRGNCGYLCTVLHDIDHTGCTHAQILLPQYNLSNEERGVLNIAELTKDILHPLQILEMCFYTLGTSFAQNKEAIDRCYTAPVVSALPQVHDANSAILTSDIVRPYSYNSYDDKDMDSAIMQRLLCLSDVLASIAVTKDGKVQDSDHDDIFEQYLTRTQDVYTEMYAAKGRVFHKPQDMLNAMKGFLDYLIVLFDSTAAFGVFEDAFIERQREILTMIKNRVSNASHPQSEEQRQDEQRVARIFSYLHEQADRLVLPNNGYHLPGDITEIGGA